MGQFAKKYRRKLSATVIGITGSYGKTTVKDMLFSVLSPHFNVVKSFQNNNNEIGVPLTLLEATAETDIVLVEMGMRKPKDIQVLSQIARPNIGILTGIGYSHFDFFKTQRHLALSKSKLFLPPLRWETSARTAFICHHSDYYDLVSEKAKTAGFSVYGYKGHTPIEDNLAVCYSVGHHFGLSDIQIREGLRHYESSHHRLERHHLNGISIIDDTYNANPHGVRHALSYLKTCKGRKLVVLGDMKELGRISQREHHLLKDPILDSGASILYTIGEEFSTAKFTDIDHTHFSDQTALQEVLLQELKQGDTVLMKASRSHQLDQLVTHIKEQLSC